MGKEAQLLEAAAAGNNTKVEQILQGKSKLKRMLSSEKGLDNLDELDGGKDAGLKVRMKRKVVHLEVDTRDDSGASPLMLAALNGHREVVLTLLTYSANVLAADDQGNSALHFAAWHNRSDIVELLLANEAVVDAPNKVGNTPLHYACQYCPQGKTLTIVKLLQYSEASIVRQNKTGDTPFSLAVRFNKKEAVTLLVDAEPKLLTETKSMIEAAKTGRTEIVEALLDAGMNPNCLDTASNTCPLHEAVRFFRRDTAKVLLEFGANFNQSNPKGETPITIVKQHHHAKKEEFVRLFLEFKGKAARIPAAHLEKTKASAATSDSSSVFITYPLLKNKKVWTKAEPEFCSAWTKQHPNTFLLDDDPTSYWKIPAAGAYTWVAFDLGSEYTLTGIRLAGWDNKQMVHTCIVETAEVLTGPWKQVLKFKADSVGYEEMSELSTPQDFKGFYASSRYWRLVVADNYGDPTSCLAEIQFFGVENDVTDWFQRLDMKAHLKDFVHRGYNQMSELALLTTVDINNYIQDKDLRRKVAHGVDILREKYFPPKGLSWAVKPAVKITENKAMPEFIVYSEPYSVGNLKVTAMGGAILGGTTTQHLITRQNGFPSRCSFTNITIGPPGRYILEVASASDPVEVLQSEPITVNPPPMRESTLGDVFDDLDKMLQF